MSAMACGVLNDSGTSYIYCVGGSFVTIPLAITSRPFPLRGPVTPTGVLLALFATSATPNHYGIVEFPYDALVKLGFLKKIVSGAHSWEELEKMGALGGSQREPVSFYVQVIPIGEKLAAKAVAVGGNLVREADGSVTYIW
jgi:hypothetical protein